MDKVATNIHVDYLKIAELVKNLSQEIEVLAALNQSELTERVCQILNQNLSAEELKTLPLKELETKIKNILLIEILSNFLKDLSPEELETFETAVGGE